MGVIYQLTFFVALAILATLITIFVFAVSLLGRALEAASKEQEKTTKDQKGAAEKEIATIQKQISTLGKKGRIDKEKLEELEAKLRQLRKQDERFEKKLSRIGKAPQLLTVKGGVLPPASWLLGALILTAGAWGLSETQNFVPVTLWILSLAAIGYSIIRIYRSLKVIESVAITSEATALKRTIEAFKIAQKELEEERKPELKLTFKGKEFPLPVKADSEVSLPLELRIHKGDFAEDVEVHIGVSQGFDFPGQHPYTLPSDHEYPNYICVRWKVGRVIAGLLPHTTITIKAPPTVGSFNMMYYIVCRGFRSTNPTELEIIVEEPELEPEDIQF